MNAIGLFETLGLTPALVALDTMEKSANVDVHQAELNDFLGVVIKLRGSLADLETALARGKAVAETMGFRPITTILRAPDQEAWRAIESAAEYNPLIQQDVVTFPQYNASHTQGELPLNGQGSFALGFIETQGFTAVFEAIDSACKAANVEVVGKEKLGGGYVTVIVKGDVAAVKAAVEAGKAQVGDLGQLIAAHVIAHPSPSVLGLLPEGLPKS